MEGYEVLEDERYRNSRRALNTLTLVVFVFILLIISIVVSVKFVHHDSSYPVSPVYNYNATTVPTTFTFADKCLPMRPLLSEECEKYKIYENSTWRNDDDGMCSQYFLKPGDICEADGECDTNDNLNNCGDGLDIYLIVF